MPETTEPQLTEAQIADIEARLKVVYAKWHDPGFTKRLLDQDIPALIRDWHALCEVVAYQQGLLDLAEFASELFKTQAQGVIEEVEKERDDLRGQLAQVTKERDELRNNMHRLGRGIERRLGNIE